MRSTHFLPLFFLTCLASYPAFSQELGDILDETLIVEPESSKPEISLRYNPTKVIGNALTTLLGVGKNECHVYPTPIEVPTYDDLGNVIFVSTECTVTCKCYKDSLNVGYNLATAQIEVAGQLVGNKTSLHYTVYDGLSTVFARSIDSADKPDASGYCIRLEDRLTQANSASYSDVQDLYKKVCFK